MKKTNVLFIGNPGVGKSTLFNALLGNVEFHAGVSFDGRGVTKILQEYTSNGITYIDTPGLNDIECRKKCAQEITSALKKTGLYYICFILSTEEGRLRPDDKVAVRLVLESAPEIGGQYSIIVNKLPKAVFEHHQAHPDVFPSIFFRDFPHELITNSIFYIKRDPNLEGEDKIFDPVVLEGFQQFLKNAPSIDIHPEKVNDIKDESWEVIVDEYARAIESMKEIMQNNQEEFKTLLKNEEERRVKAEKIFRKRQKEVEERHKEEIQNMQAQIIALATRPTHCCFPSGATVRLEDGSLCAVSELKEGQFVQTVDDTGKLCFSEVYYVDGETGWTPMYSLSCDDFPNRQACLTATEEHLIYASSQRLPIEEAIKADPITIGSTQVGQFIYISDQVQGSLRPHQVTKISCGLARGRWSVLTLQHRLLVNDVLASSYEIHQSWGLLDTFIMRKLYSVWPSFVTSPTNKWFCKQYDLCVEPIIKSCKHLFLDLLHTPKG